MRSTVQRQMTGFAMVGGLGFVVDIGVFTLLVACRVPEMLARALAFLPATLITWLLNRSYVFDSDSPGNGPLAAEYARYLVVQGAGIAINFLAFAIVRALAPELPALLALATGSGVALVSNFLGAQKYVFRPRAAGGHPGEPGGLPLWVWLGVPAIFGALAVLLGQDANWDLHNYHRYNPYAWLTGRIGMDLAPAGMQTYFNPLMDMPGFWMGEHLPPRAGGFVMGYFHGLVVPLLMWTVRSAIPSSTPFRTSLGLALAGGLGATFLSELGTSMGDDTSAVPVLLGLAWVAAHWRQLSHRGLMVRALAVCVAAGFFVGLATGLKLTNAPFAVGLAAAMLWVDCGWRGRVALSAATSVGVLLGICATGGYWYWTMWHQYGNPLFPQFNNIFQSDLAGVVGVVDTRWRPRGIVEALLFPYVFTLQPARIGEIKIVQLLWPAAYTLVLACAAHAAFRRRKPATAVVEPGTPARSAFGFVLAFACISYTTWLVVFSIGRYTVVLELLLPLITWVLLQRLFNARVAAILGIAVVGASVAVSVLRMENWGYAGWASRRYEVQVPPDLMLKPGAVVLLDSPHAWMIPDLPPNSVYLSLGQFPESDGYRMRAREIMASRPNAYAIVGGTVDSVASTLGRFNQWAGTEGIARGSVTCRFIDIARKASRRFKHLEPTPPAGAAQPCTYSLPDQFRADIVAGNLAQVVAAAALAGKYGLDVQIQTCRAYPAFMGSKELSFQLCEVLLMPSTSPTR